MKKFLFTIAAFAMICLASCGPKRSQAYYDAPSQLLSSNYDGTFVIGIQSAHSGMDGLKPLCFDKNAREKHEDYFRVFFQDDGPWKKYADLRDKRTTTTRYQRDGRQMIETVTVSVDRAALKDRLIADGIIPPGGRY